MVASRSDFETMSIADAERALGPEPRDPLERSMWRMRRRNLDERIRREALSPEERAAEDANLKAHADAVEANRKAEERRVEAQRMADAHFPDRLIGQILDNRFDEKKPAFKQLIDALNEQKKIVVLSGPAGCGKTTAACMAPVGSGMSFLFLSAWRRTHTSIYSEEAESWADVGFLILDDVGEEYQDEKGFTASMLDQLVSERYDNSNVTVMTTNLPAGRFTERCGARIVDRIREVGVFIELAEDSMRKRGGETNSG